MKIKLLLFTFLFTSLSYAQDTEEYNTSVVVIRDKIYKMRHGLHKTNDSIVNTSITYTAVDLSNIAFKTTKAALLPESYDDLNTLSRLLKEHPNMNVKIEGHTDKIGNSKKNLKLSKKRARTIKLYLFKQGVKFKRMTAIGYGDTTTLCDAPCTKNQRVEFTLIENGKPNRLARNWNYDFDKMYRKKKN